jgi:protein phosphatase
VTTLRHGAATDVGRVRANNQDQLLVSTTLFAVADGMGGHAAGEVASLTAIEALRAAFASDRTAAGLVSAAGQANRAIWERAQTDPELRGMGTTLVAAALVTEDGEERVAIINVGDSRVYLLRHGELEQLTTDHSLVQELIDDGQLSEAEADLHPQRNVLTRALGVDPDVKVDCLQVLPVKGDRFLLCSDGLYRDVSEAQVASTLRRLSQPQDAVKELVAQARAHGGSDNITVVVFDIVDDDDQAAAASAALADEPGVVIPSAIGKEDPDGDGGRRGRARQRGRRRARHPRARPITVRVVGFTLVLLALVAAAFYAIDLYARGSYFVGVDHSQLTIYKGRPGGLLWFQPTVVERTGVPTTDVLQSRLSDLQSGKVEANLAAARQYVHNLQTEGAQHQVGATTTTTVPGAGPPGSTAPPTTATASR